MPHPSRRKKVLLVTSSYFPITVADMHRVRHLAWELPKLGWDTEILVPNLEFQRPDFIEPESAPIFNAEIPCHEVAPKDFYVYDLLRMRSIAWRALWPVAEAGSRLLKSGSFDLIYISTANFNLFCLGRWWARRFKIPYLVDYHDPWVRKSVNYTTTKNRLKRWISSKLSVVMERYALKAASAIVSVSPVYIEELRERYKGYKCLQQDRAAVIPFSGSEIDFRENKSGSQSETRSEIEIVYTGAGGAIMARSFTCICRVLTELKGREPALFTGLKIRLYGTYASWRPGDPTPLREIAEGFGLGDVVEEHPTRITYMKSIDLLRKSRGLLVLGVDDVAYMPSKLFTYGLSRKPILACFREGSPPVEVFNRLQGFGALLTFNDNGELDPIASINSVREYLTHVRSGETIDRREMMAPFLAPAMANQHKELFERICSLSLQE